MKVKFQCGRSHEAHFILCSRLSCSNGLHTGRRAGGKETRLTFIGLACTSKEMVAKVLKVKKKSPVAPAVGQLLKNLPNIHSTRPLQTR